MNQHNSSRLSIIVKTVVIALLLSQSATTRTEIDFTLWNVSCTSLACAAGFAAFVLEFKKPEKDAPILKKHATFFDKVLYYLDRIIGQKKRTKFYEDEDGKLRVVKIYPRGLGSIYVIVKQQALPWLAVFQTWDKLKGNFFDFTERTGIASLTGIETQAQKKA